jgi:hypothetical protein
MRLIGVAQADSTTWWTPIPHRNDMDSTDLCTDPPLRAAAGLATGLRRFCDRCAGPTPSAWQSIADGRRRKSQRRMLGSPVAPGAVASTLQIRLDPPIVPIGDDFNCEPAILACLLGGECCEARADPGGRRGVRSAARNNSTRARSGRQRRARVEDPHRSAPARAASTPQQLLQPAGYRSQSYFNFCDPMFRDPDRGNALGHPNRCDQVPPSAEMRTNIDTVRVTEET